VLLDEGTPRERKFQFEQVRMIATIAAGVVPDVGRIQLHRLAGSPRTFTLQVGDDGTHPGDFVEGSGFLQITFTNRTPRTNLFTVDLPKTVALGEPAPDFSAEDVFTHQRRTLADFKGKIVVLKFWATDCAPCQPEMQESNELIARRKREWKDAVVVVGVGMDGDGKRLRKHIQKQGWNEFQHVWAKDTNSAFSSGIAKSYGVRAIPACYVIHPTGLVVWRGNRGNLEELIRILLTEVKGKEDVQRWLKKLREVDESR
jgi:peroxiredoxin